MKYKEYSGKVIFDEDAKIFHGEVVGIKDVVTFQGTTVEELEQAFKDSVDEYLDFCKELNRKPEKPFSGKFMLRVNPEIHERMAYEARNCGISLNTWVKDAILQILKAVPNSHHSLKDRKFNGVWYFSLGEGTRPHLIHFGLAFRLFNGSNSALLYESKTTQNTHYKQFTIENTGQREKNKINDLLQRHV